MRSLLRALTLTLAATLGLACGPDPETPSEAAVRDFELLIGTWNQNDEIFYELEKGQRVPLVQGFQGLLFINLALLGDRQIPARFEAEVELVFEDYDERYTFWDRQLLFEPLDDVWRVVPSFRVPFRLRVSEVAGRPVRLSVTLTSGEWSATSECSFIVADATCTHEPDGTFVCEE